MGAGGTVGAGVLQAISAHNHFDLVCAFTRQGPIKRTGKILWSRLDVLDSMAVMEAGRRFPPIAVINAAALTDVDGCEQSPDDAWRTNVLGAQYLAHLCAHRRVHLIHLSTDYVFSGIKSFPGPYCETDTPQPLSVYGKTKRVSEIEVQSICEDLAPWTVVRSSAIYGDSLGGRPGFVTFVRNQLEHRLRASIVCDQWITPTLASNLGLFLLWLVNQTRTGIYHLSGSTYISRYEWALLIARHFGLDSELIISIASSSLHQLAPRPHWGGLRSLRTESDLLEGAPPLVGVREGLAQLGGSERAGQ